MYPFVKVPELNAMISFRCFNSDLLEQNKNVSYPTCNFSLLMF